jgi:hypothetical protein
VLVFLDDSGEDGEADDKRGAKRNRLKKNTHAAAAAKKKSAKTTTTETLGVMTQFSTVVSNPIVVVNTVSDLCTSFENRVKSYLYYSSNPPSIDRSTIHDCYSADACNGSKTLASWGRFSLVHKLYEKNDCISLSRNKQIILSMTECVISSDSITFSSHSNKLPEKLHLEVFCYSFKLFCFLLGMAIPELKRVDLKHNLTPDEFTGLKQLDGITYSKDTDHLSYGRSMWVSNFRKKTK